METTLYDKTGQPTAYIATDKETIYLWSGKAAAYIQDDKLYGFNGCHLGWIKNGVIYTQSGAKIGFRSDKCPAARHTSPVKCIKQEKKTKVLRQVARIRPILQLGCADEGFRVPNKRSLNHNFNFFLLYSYLPAPIKRVKDRYLPTSE